MPCLLHIPEHLHSMAVALWKHVVAAHALFATALTRLLSHGALHERHPAGPFPLFPSL